MADLPPHQPLGAATPGPSPAVPGAAAARRARRMGGRPRPYPTAPGGRPDSDIAPEAAAAEPDEPTATAALDTEPGTDPEPQTDTEPGTGRARRRRAVALGLAVLVFLGLCVAAVVLGLRVFNRPPLFVVNSALNDQVLAAAKSDVPLITSYSYKNIEQDSAKAQAVLTGQFKKDYTQSINTVVKPQLPTTKTVAVGQVTTAGLESASADGTQVVVVVFGQQSVTNVTQTTPRIDPFQLRVTMQKVGSQWLVAKLDQLGAA